MSSHHYDRTGERIDHDDETVSGPVRPVEGENARDPRPRVGVRPSNVPDGASIGPDAVRPLGQVVTPVAPHDCAAGWLGEDDAGHPIPCLHCRPHLARREHRP